MHKNQHSQAGVTVRLNERAGPEHRAHPAKPGAWITIEDWWDRVAGMSWTQADRNPAAMIYGLRTGQRYPDDALPYDDEVVYGKIENEGVIVHVLELDGEAGRQAAEEYAARESIAREMRR